MKKFKSIRANLTQSIMVILALIFSTVLLVVTYLNIQTIKGNIRKIQGNIASNNRIMRYNNILLILLIALLIFQSAFLYFIMIRKTHRISGPIYVMSNYMREIIDGRSPSIRPIRKNDELQDFYHLFSQLVASLRERRGKES